MTVKVGGARKCSSKSPRCRGKTTKSKKQMYWKAKRADPCDGFYFEIGPKGGLASQQKHGLYPEPGTAEFLKQMRSEHQRHVGNTYSSSRYHKSRLLGKGPSSESLKPENTPNTYCGNAPGKEFLDEDVDHHDAEWAALMKASAEAEKKHDKKRKSKKKKKKGGARTKVSQKKYSCQRCSFKTKSQKQLNDHIKNRH